MSVAKLRGEILPSVFDSLVDCELDSGSAGQDQFQSSVVFLTAVLDNGGKQVKVPLVVKFEPTSEELREFLKSTIQFYNEVLMYSEVLPLLDQNNICGETFPGFYHGVGKLDGSGSDNIVIIEDLRPAGYRLTESRGFISLEHLTLAMNKLGRFHALSYAAKRRSREFLEVAGQLREAHWEVNLAYLAIVRACFHRPAEHLIRQGKHVERLGRLLERFDRDILGFMRQLVAPEEPSAVVCHGDFCRNNLLFRYLGGAPVDVRLFDLATARYSSPVVDISFFLLLNASPETRRAHWDDLLATYHRALASALPGAPVPSLYDLREELRRKALYGFVHCSFFLPAMLFPHPYSDLEKVMRAPVDEVARDYALIGGQEGTLLLADMLEELIQRGCVPDTLA